MPQKPLKSLLLALLLAQLPAASMRAQAPSAPPPEAPARGMIPGPPTLRAEPSSVEFGFVPVGESRKATVTLTNTGSAPVRIIAVQASCACTTTSDLAGQQIAPGATASFDATLAAAPVAGPKHATIKVLVEGFERVLEVEVRAEIAQSLRAVPSAITPPPHGPKVGRVVLESIDRRPFRVLSSNGAPPQFLGFNPARDDPRSTYVLRTDLGSIPDDRRPPCWLVETDRADCPVLAIRVRDDHLSVPPVLRMRDFSTGLGVVAPGEPREVSLECLERLDGEVTVAGTPRLTAELLAVTPSKDGSTVKLRLTPAAGTDGAFFDRVELRAMGKAQPLQVWAVVRAPAPAAAPAQR